MCCGNRRKRRKAAYRPVGEHGWEEGGTEQSDGMWVRISAEGYVRALKHNVMVYPGKTTLVMLELAPVAG